MFFEARQCIHIWAKLPGGLQIYSVNKTADALTDSLQRGRCDTENSSAHTNVFLQAGAADTSGIPRVLLFTLIRHMTSHDF